MAEPHRRGSMPQHAAGASAVRSLLPVALHCLRACLQQGVASRQASALRQAAADRRRAAPLTRGGCRRSQPATMPLPHPASGPPWRWRGPCPPSPSRCRTSAWRGARVRAGVCRAGALRERPAGPRWLPGPHSQAQRAPGAARCCPVNPLGRLLGAPAWVAGSERRRRRERHSLSASWQRPAMWHPSHSFSLGGLLGHLAHVLGGLAHLALGGMADLRQAGRASGCRWMEAVGQVGDRNRPASAELDNRWLPGWLARPRLPRPCN